MPASPQLYLGTCPFDSLAVVLSTVLEKDSPIRAYALTHWEPLTRFLWRLSFFIGALEYLLIRTLQHILLSHV
jgi:hypothetical protein